MKRITIGNKEYIIEYSIRASLYDECTKSVMNVFVKASMSETYAKTGDAQSAIDGILDTLANLPKRAVTLFYAGLLEHHGAHGDHSVNTRAEAEELAARYLIESKKSWATLNAELMECIGEDNFFGLIGLNEIMPENNEAPKKSRKKDGKNESEN